MDDVTRSGRTVLFVTHGLGMITQLCQRAVLLRDGRVSMIGPAAEVVDHYNAIWNS
jgi:ABC-type polysaccharide/polyol phosphate transport system ATPase subunit